VKRHNAHEAFDAKLLRLTRPPALSKLEIETRKLAMSEELFAWQVSQSMQPHTGAGKRFKLRNERGHWLLDGLAAVPLPVAEGIKADDPEGALDHVVRRFSAIKLKREQIEVQGVGDAK
jgi:hypothetical protein